MLLPFQPTLAPFEPRFVRILNARHLRALEVEPWKWAQQKSISLKLIIATPSRRTLREQTPESESRVGHPKNLFVEPFLALAQNDNHVSVSWCCFSRTAFPERSAVNKSHENLFDSATAHYVGRRWIGGRRRKSAADFRDLPQTETSLSSSVCLSPVCVRLCIKYLFIEDYVTRRWKDQLLLWTHSWVAFPVTFRDFILIFSMIIRRCLFFPLSEMPNKALRLLQR